MMVLWSTYGSQGPCSGHAPFMLNLNSISLFWEKLISEGSMWMLHCNYRIWIGKYTTKTWLSIIPCGFGIYTNVALFVTVICRYTKFNKMFTCVVKSSDI